MQLVVVRTFDLMWRIFKLIFLRFLRT